MSAALLVLAAQISVGAQAIPVLTHANPVPGDSSLTQARVTQAVAYGAESLAGGRVRLHAMVDLEGWTMEHGQLALGNFGEGYTDKRHPHTWAHELIATAQDVVMLPADLHWSLSGGKGFAPFGTADPMNRPTLIYPANHHWSQVLERAVLIVGLRRGPVTLEAGLFNGDEPEKPSQWPNWSRFGDSWSARALVEPARGLELQLSHAQVASPEHRQGAGLDHAMWSASATANRAAFGGEGYAHAEWAHTDEEGVYQYSTLLAEAQLLRGRHRPYLRFEHTDRPEEQRVLGDDFRSIRPHNENSNLGITGWATLTAGYGFRVTGPDAKLRVEGIVEGAWSHVTNVTGVLRETQPEQFYGRNDLGMISVALRVGAGAPVHRMGRYGVAASAAAHHVHEP